MKGYVMIKKGSLLLIVLLLSLPSCWQKKDKKASQPKKSKKVAQMAPDRAPDEFELADADMESFFSELGEFDLADADDETMRKEEFAWADEDDESRLDSVYFAFDSADVQGNEADKVRSSADKAKQLLAEAQADGFEATVVVDGYACKSAGSEEYNKEISAKRAQHVAEQLVESGIREEDVKIKAHGSTNLVVEDGSRDEQEPNRRVELHVVYS
ncbi:OmpA family protein [Candidatus Dependentiae bacterium]|nr:MAG: OmpA family protein [Candidatus Dependentiae bacterium]